MTRGWARAAVWLGFNLFGACDAASFESLGKLAPTTSGSAAPSLDAGSHEAAAPQLAMDAATMVVAPATAAAGSDARDSGDAGSGSGAAGKQAAAGSGGAAGAPGALGGRLDSMPFSVRDGYVAGLSDELRQTAVYLFDSSVSCTQVSSFAWLSQLPATTHVIEITFPSTAQTGTPVMNASVSYLHGGTNAFSKMRASASTLILSHVTQTGPVDGTLMATFGPDMIEGAFHAAYCATATGL